MENITSVVTITTEHNREFYDMCGWCRDNISQAASNQQLLSDSESWSVTHNAFSLKYTFYFYRKDDAIMFTLRWI